MDNEKLAIPCKKVSGISREFFGIENCQFNNSDPTIFNKINSFIKQFDSRIEGMVHKTGRGYYLVNPELLQIKNSIKRDVYSLGLYLGEFRKDFIPSPALMELIAKNSKRKIFVNKKSEWLFLCRRNIFPEGILKSNVEEGLVLVQNENDENLGYGIIKREDGKMFVKNLLDRGSYLRIERNR